MLRLENTPYSLEQSSQLELVKQVGEFESRVALLRSQGRLNEQTLRDYFGEKRFEQIAESNAIEGSTLSVGETELAVLRGVTITGHDPAYVRDARSLDLALNRMVEMARTVDEPTDIEQLKEIHSLILGDRDGAGLFRSQPVYIKGASHRPPATWREVMAKMEEWENWSLCIAPDAPAILRSVVLHAWLSHVHPFIDGNGRTCRMISNLEFIRKGYPSIIIKKKDRERYIEALAESDAGGDLRGLFDLFFEKAEGSLVGLELSAKLQQGFDPIVARIRQRQTQQLEVWNASVNLLVKAIEHFFTQQLERIQSIGGSGLLKEYNYMLDLEDFVSLCERKSLRQSWAFRVSLSIPGFPKKERLAFLGFRTPAMYQALNHEGGPSVFWSVKNPDGYPKWISADTSAPCAVEMTSRLGAGDEWLIRRYNGCIEEVSTTRLAERVTKALFDFEQP